MTDDNVIPLWREKTANEEFEDGLKELCDRFCERVAEENENLHGCACGGSCCGDSECCGPCFVEPPLTMRDFLKRGEKIRTLDKKLQDTWQQLATARRERDAQKEWVAIQAGLIAKLQSDLNTSVTVRVHGSKETTTLEAQ